MNLFRNYYNPIRNVMLIIFFVLTDLSLIAQTQPEYPVIRLNDELEVREILPNAFVITHKFPWGGTR